MGGRRLAWRPGDDADRAVHPHPAAMIKSFRTSTQGLKSWYMGLFQLPALPELLAGKTLAKSLTASGLPAASVRAYEAAMAEPGALTGALNWTAACPLGPGAGGPNPGADLLYRGRNDPALGRPAAELTADYITGPYTFVELDSGHWLPETDPDAVADAILRRMGS